MTDRFHDYIRDLPMQIGRKFMPSPQINLPTLSLLRIQENELPYNFEKEQLARRQYEESLRVTELENSAHSSAIDDSKSSSAPGISSTSQFVFSNEVLLPSKIDLPSKENTPKQKTKNLHSNFDDLEYRGCSIFDDLELKTIDDRAGLSQVLSKLSVNPVASANTEICSQKDVINLSTNGVASFSANPNHLLKNGDILANSRREASRSSTPQSGISSTPPPIPVHQVSASRPDISTKPSSNDNPAIAQLRARLVTKGYRENIVATALERLPQERIQFIEYYMKSMRALEKVGVNTVEALDFLVSCQLEDKQKIVDYGSMGAQFVQMGFTAGRSFAAIRAKSGDKVAALDVLLAEQR